MFFINLGTVINISAHNYKVKETKCVDGIVYKVLDNINRAFVFRGESPYKGDIVIPKVVRLDSGDLPVIGIARSAFYNSRELHSVDIQGYVMTIYKYQFYNCFNLNEVKLPPSLTSVGEYAFFNCYKLENPKFPDSLKYIYEGAFKNCFNLKDVCLPDSVTYLGNDALKMRNYLTTYLN